MTNLTIFGIASWRNKDTHNIISSLCGFFFIFKRLFSGNFQVNFSEVGWANVGWTYSAVSEGLCYWCWHWASEINCIVNSTNAIHIFYSEIWPTLVYLRFIYILPGRLIINDRLWLINASYQHLHPTYLQIHIGYLQITTYSQRVSDLVLRCITAIVE